MRRFVGEFRYWLMRMWRRRRVVRVEGPLEKIGGRWLMRIPLTVGGDVLLATVTGIRQIKDDILEIELPDLLVKNLKLKEGQHLFVHNATGEFTFEWYPNGSASSTPN
jgi:hypothetical protein